MRAPGRRRRGPAAVATAAAPPARTAASRSTAACTDAVQTPSTGLEREQLVGRAAVRVEVHAVDARPGHRKQRVDRPQRRGERVADARACRRRRPCSSRRRGSSRRARAPSPTSGTVVLARPDDASGASRSAIDGRSCAESLAVHEPVAVHGDDAHPAALCLGEASQLRQPVGPIRSRGPASVTRGSERSIFA